MSNRSILPDSRGSTLPVSASSLHLFYVWFRSASRMSSLTSNGLASVQNVYMYSPTVRDTCGHITRISISVHSMRNTDILEIVVTEFGHMRFIDGRDHQKQWSSDDDDDDETQASSSATQAKNKIANTRIINRNISATNNRMRLFHSPKCSDSSLYFIFFTELAITSKEIPLRVCVCVARTWTVWTEY